LIDIGEVKRHILQDSKDFHFREVRYDPQFCFLLEQSLIDEGLDMVAVQQSYMMLSSPTIKLEQLIREGRLIHPMNEALTWSALNTVVRSNDAGQILIARKKSTARVDPISAAINAVSSLMAHANENYSGSYFD
jgi:phage terminase large subunit-like protein